MTTTGKTDAENRSTDSAVEAGIAFIQQFYESGKAPPEQRQSIPFLDGKAESTRKEYLEKARKFATPEVYSQPEREELIALCRKFDFKIGVAIILSLLKVPDHKVRCELQLEMVKDKWSCAALNREIALRFPKENTGSGRQPRKPESEEVAWRDIGELHTRLIKIFERAVEVINQSQSRRRPSSQQKSLERTKRLRRHIVQVARSILDAEFPATAITQNMLNRLANLSISASEKHATPATKRIQSLPKISARNGGPPSSSQKEPSPAPAKPKPGIGKRNAKKGAQPRIRRAKRDTANFAEWYT